MKWLHSRASETCSLSLKVRALNAHALAPDSAEGNRHTRPSLQGTASYRGFVNFMHDLLQDIWLLLSVRIFIPSSEHPKQAKIVLSARLFTTSIHVLTSVCFVVRGESPGCRLFGTASMLDWLRKVLPHHSQGSTTERWSRNTSVLRPRFFLTSPFI